MIDSFRAARWIRTLNLLLQGVLLLTFIGGLNYIARSHALRWDLTRYRRFSLSAETLAYLHELSQPVHVVVTSGANNQAADPQIMGILREYVYATESNPGGAVTVEYIDLYEDRRKTEKYEIDSPGVVLLLCGDRRRVLTADAFYQVDKDRANKDFVGEQALTSAILDVSNPERKKIYFLAGHGELRVDDVDKERGLSLARDQLRLRNFSVEPLNLDAARQIPADAALLVCVQPQDPFTPLEQEQLRQYLGAGAGRLILFAAPATQLGLSDLLIDDWGIILDDDLILDTAPDSLTEDNDFIIRAFAPHPITQTLIDYRVGLRMGPARSVRPLPGHPAGLTVTTLAATSKTAWGEVDYRRRGPQGYTPGVDIKGFHQMDPPDRLGVAVASERVPVQGGLPSSVRGGKVVVVGTGDLISNARLATSGAEEFFLGAVNWTVGRDVSLNVPARPIERFSLSLSAGELTHLRYTLMLALPGLAALLGILVYWARRN